MLSSSAPIYLNHNSTYGNNTDTASAPTICGELVVNHGSNVQADRNLLATSGSTACNSQTDYAFSANYGGSTDALTNTLLYSAAGNNTNISSTSSGLVQSNIVTGVSPAFSNPVIPPAPSCSGAANTVACMASVIADYTPTNTEAQAYGYQKPSSTPDSNPLFPQWLCNVNLPSGLVTMGCSGGA